jgi:hypothetical protein
MKTPALMMVVPIRPTARDIYLNEFRANHGRTPKGLYSDKQTLEELRTGLIESAGIEFSAFFLQMHVQIVRRGE